MALARPTDAPPLYSQDGKGYSATVHAHYFVAGCDWLVTEYDPDEDIAFGWVCLNGDRQNSELGYVSLAELEQVRVPLTVRMRTSEQLAASTYNQALEVEYDLHWPAGVTLGDGIAELDRRQGRSDG